MVGYEMKEGSLTIRYGYDHTTGIFFQLEDERLAVITTDSNSKEHQDPSTKEFNDTCKSLAENGSGGGIYFNLHTDRYGLGSKVSTKTILKFYEHYGVPPNDIANILKLKSKRYVPKQPEIVTKLLSPFLGDEEETNINVREKEQEEDDVDTRSSEGIHPCSAESCTNAGILRCSRCKKDSYCSVACRRGHWRVHRATCRKPNIPVDLIMEDESSLLPARRESCFGMYEEEEKSEDKTEKKSPCEEVAEAFYDCVRGSLYPPKMWERIYGVQMGNSTAPNDLKDYNIGKLVCPVWYDLIANKKITKEDICQALHTGNLPQFFEENVRSLYADCKENKYHVSGYTMELLEHGFQDIPWDFRIHRKLKFNPPT